MAYTTHNIQETQDWIKRIIDSCEYFFHFESAQLVIDNFKRNISNDEKEVAVLQSYFDLKKKDMKVLS